MINAWFLQDGAINPAALDEIEASLKATTDQTGGLMDIVTQKNFTPAFVCNHSGLLLLGDYVKEWGRKYGIGMGPDVSSEVLDSDYHTDPPAITPQIKSIDQIMHPIGPCFSQVDRVMVSPLQFASSEAVMDRDDTDIKIRARIVRARQLINPLGKLRTMQAAWERVSR